MHRIRELIKGDAERMQLLTAVASLALPDCYIAAGFVRNLVWDCLHGYERTSLNDVDVVFFDRANISDDFPNRIQEMLSLLEPSVRWEVKNQAVMHIRNNDQPYASTADAMSYWPEKETAVGVRLNSGAISVVAPFGVETLFAGCISYNPKRSRSVFLQRLAEKQWLDKWPRLKVVL